MIHARAALVQQKIADDLVTSGALLARYAPWSVACEPYAGKAHARPIETAPFKKAA
jgi:hypothetical protein